MCVCAGTGMHTFAYAMYMHMPWVNVHVCLSARVFVSLHAAGGVEMVRRTCQSPLPPEARAPTVSMGSSLPIKIYK